MGTDCPDIYKIVHYMKPPVVLNSTYKKQEEQDVMDGANKTDCRQKMFFKTVSLTTVQLFVLVVVCACFYVCEINVIVELCVR